ncbi:MAG TPA: hypothetical protein V6D29_01730, partial [Leptolyngbyaceae cyanobacterium]
MLLLIAGAMLMVKLLPVDRFTLTTPYSLPQVVENLATYIEPIKPIRWQFSENHAPYQGKVSEAGFEISRLIHYRNSALPMIRGQFETLPVGTAVHVRMGMHPLVIGFMAFWYLAWYGALTPMWLFGALPSDVAPLFLGLPLLILVVFWGAFWYEAKRSRQDLSQMIAGGLQATAYFAQKKGDRRRLIPLQLAVLAV